MKRSLTLSLLLAAAVPAFAESDRNAVTPAARPRLTEEARRRVEDAAIKNSRAASVPSASTAPTEGVRMLPPILVEASYAFLLRTAPDDTPLSQPFTWREGGTIMKAKGAHVTTEFKFQYVPRHKGFDLLSISW